MSDNTEVIDPSTDEEAFQYEGYAEEVERLKKYRDDLDGLFDEELQDLKEIKQKIKRSSGVRGGLTYITAQTSNLIALKNAAISVTNNIVSTKSKETTERLKISPPTEDDSVSIAAIQKILEITHAQTDIQRNSTPGEKDITPQPTVIENGLEDFDNIFDDPEMFEEGAVVSLVDEERETQSLRHMVWLVESSESSKWVLVDEDNNIHEEEITQEMPEPESLDEERGVALINGIEYPIRKSADFIVSEW